jgi:hypothetical protein
LRDLLRAGPGGGSGRAARGDEVAHRSYAHMA